MNIIQINTQDNLGGAARAALRLHRGLRLKGENSLMLVKEKGSADPTIIHTMASSNPRGTGADEFAVTGEMIDDYITSHRSAVSNTLFTIPFGGYDVSNMAVVRDAHIINLHWISYYQSLDSLNELISLGKPVVWTLHDQWAFTGGCHYSSGCKNFMIECADCPQVENDPYDIPRAVFRDKLEFFRKNAITFVTPSQWLKQTAESSRLLNGFRIEVISNSVETDIFVPSSKMQAKKEIGLDPGILTILFGAISVDEKRKGFSALEETFRYVKENHRLNSRLKDKKLAILSFGEVQANEFSEMPVHSLGYIGSDEEISRVYNASDIFVLPSLEDNFPNTVLESMSCGTPVVGFETGGIPEAIENEKTGCIVPLKNTFVLAEAIVELLTDDEKRQQMGRQARQAVENKYSLEHQAERYLKLYDELLEESHRGHAGSRFYSINSKETADYSQTVLVDTLSDSGVNLKHVCDRMYVDILKAELRKQKEISQKRLEEIDRRGGEIIALKEQSAALKEQIKKYELLKEAGGLGWFVGLNEGFTDCNPIEVEKTENQNGLISVIIPIFNYEKYLDECITSIWNQKPCGLDIEIVAIDDGSRDNSLDIAKNLTDRSPIPMTVLQHPNGENKGVSAARNLGLMHARGNWICMLDADDAWEPHKLKRQIAYLRSHPEAAALCSYGYNVDDNGQPAIGWTGGYIAGDYSQVPPPHNFKGPYAIDQMVRGCPIVNSTVITKKELFQEIGGYKEGLSHQGEDWLMWSQISLKHPFHVIEEPLIRYRVHPGSWTTRYQNEGLSETVKFEYFIELLYWMMTRDDPETRHAAYWIYKHHFPFFVMPVARYFKELDELVKPYLNIHSQPNGWLHLDTFRSFVQQKVNHFNKLNAEFNKLNAELAKVRQRLNHLEHRIDILKKIPGVNWTFQMIRAVRNMGRKNL